MKHTDECLYRFDNDITYIRDRITHNINQYLAIPINKRPLMLIRDKTLKIDYLECNNSYKIKNKIIELKGEEYTWINIYSTTIFQLNL